MVRKKYCVTKSEHTWDKYQRPYSGELTTRRRQFRNDGKGKKQLWILVAPLLDVLILNLSLIACYVIALVRNDTEPLPRVPYISELCSTPPQSYVFTVGMTATSFTTIVIVFFRYKQVSFSRDGCLNKVSALLGYLAATSKLLLGAIQYHSNFKWLHYSTFISYSLFSFLFIVSQVFLTHSTKSVSSTATLLIRLVLALLMVVFGVLFGTFISAHLRHMNKPPYNVAQIAQWIYWVLLNCYTLTFIQDFAWIRVSWDVRSFSRANDLTVGENTDFLGNSHELDSLDSIAEHSNNSVNSLLNGDLPMEFATMV